MQAVATDSPPVVDFTAIKGRQQAAWSAGNYAVVGTTLQIVGESLCEALDLHAGQRVLDVAAGNGNATLAADLIALAQRFNSASDGTLAAPSEYLEVVITTR